MPLRNPRRAAPLLAAVLALLLLAPAQALPSRQDPGLANAPERLVQALWEWLADLWPGPLQKNGAQIDPNGAPQKNGAQTDPDGRTNSSGTTTGPSSHSENGAQIDPDG